MGYEKDQKYIYTHWTVPLIAYCLFILALEYYIECSSRFNTETIL